MTDAVDKDTFDVNPITDSDGHNFMPWLALLVFQPSELVVSDGDAKMLGLKADGMTAYNPLKLPPDGAYQMSVGQYLSNIQSRVCYEAGYQLGHLTDHTKPLDQTADQEYQDMKKSPEVTSVIFPTKAQLKTMLGGTSIPVEQPTSGNTPAPASDTTPTTAGGNTPATVGGNAPATAGGISPTATAATSPAANPTPKTVLDLSPLKAQRLMSHVRHINTIGFPDAGVEEEGLFSIVVSAVTGDQNETLPSTHIVHLVSLEHIDSTLTNPKSSYFTDNATNSSRIGLVSLFSWTYNCIPESVSFTETMTELANTAQPLRPPQKVLDNLKGQSGDPVKQAMYERLNSGYTIARWRTPTGKESVAFNRGPLVPMPTQDVPTASATADVNRLWPSLSMTGKDYAVFDSSTGIMDATYSAAWSLGKLMAISDSAFNAALMRFRSCVWEEASSLARMFAGGIDSKDVQLDKSAAAALDALKISGETFTGTASRINKPNDLFVPPSVDDKTMNRVFRELIDYVVDHLSSAVPAGADKAITYNGFDGSPGNNSDWEVILNWIHDVMYLATIPAHVLFPEPSHLQSLNRFPTPAGQSTFHPEALRFFHIDHAWIDAYLDGALSVANHLEPDFDYTRLRIKAIVNHYLETPIGNTGKNPPVPRYGFVLKSSVVKATPDLRLTVRSWTQETKDGKTTWTDRDCLVRHTKMDDFTILSLIDCLPEEIRYIKMAQPAHQQRFALKCKLHGEDDDPRIHKIVPDISIKQLYTDLSQAPPLAVDDPTKSLEWMAFKPEDFTKYGLSPLKQSEFYDDQTRCINPVKIGTGINSLLQKWGQHSSFKGKPPYDDSVTNSCILGLELNDPAYELRIDGPTGSTGPTDPFPSWTRKLWCGKTIPTAVTPRKSKPNPDDVKKVRKPKPPPSIMPPSDIIPNAPTTNPPREPPKTWMNNTTVIARAPLKVKVNVTQPFGDSPNHQFELLVHPAYRPHPPKPFRDPEGPSGRDVFSPIDYLPVGTKSLYDVIFAVRRKKNADTDKTLKSITIEIPVAPAKAVANVDPTDKILVNQFSEPLLDSTDYSNVGIAMVSNPRFVPTLYSGAASTIGLPLWDGRPVLGITLVPKSGLSSGVIALKQDGKTMEASVRLSEGRVLDIINQKAKVMVAHFDNGQVSNVAEKRGMSMIRMVERYGNEKKDEYQVSWCVALKKAPQDGVVEVDLSNNPV